MERLPHEVRLYLFKLLPHQDQLTCLIVSKDWNSFIKLCLFNHVKLHSANLKDAVTFFRKYPEIATKVLQFEITYCDFLSQLSVFPQLFPNLKKVRLSGHGNFPQGTSVSALGAWRNLKEMDTDDFYATKSPSMTEILLSNLLPDLTTLSLRIVFKEQRVNGISETISARVVPLLKNAPQLSRLKISTVNCPLPNLEAIHQSAPYLTSLKLSGNAVTQRIKPTEPLQTVRLTDLSIDLNGEPDHVTLISNYVFQKYAGLISFSVVAVNQPYYAFDKPSSAERERIALLFFAQNPQLTYYDHNLFPLTQTIVNEMDQYDIQLDGIKMYIDCDTVERQCVAISNSKQSRSINRLFLQLNYLANDSPLSAGIIKQALTSFNNFTNLTDLTIKANGNFVCFSQFTTFLNMMPNLLKLSVHDMIAVSTDDYIDDIAPNLQIKTINIHNLIVRSTQTANEVIQKLLLFHTLLEEFKLDVYIAEQASNYPCMILDFRKSQKLKSITINTQKHTNKYRIRRNTLAESGYYFHDAMNNRFVKEDIYWPNDYHTIVFLNRPVLFNSCYI